VFALRATGVDHGAAARPSGLRPRRRRYWRVSIPRPRSRSRVQDPSPTSQASIPSSRSCPGRSRRTYAAQSRRSRITRRLYTPCGKKIRRQGGLLRRYRRRRDDGVEDRERCATRRNEVEFRPSRSRSPLLHAISRPKTSGRTTRSAAGLSKLGEEDSLFTCRTTRDPTSR
jgi:hypothetical protein